MNPTREKILDTAEQMFSKGGIASTSLRSIIAQAGVNIAAVHYHFGSKHKLALEVFSRRLIPLNQKRLSLLDELEEQHASERIPLSDLVHAFIDPALELGTSGATGQSFMQLMGRAHSEPDLELRKEIMSLFEDVVQRFIPAFQESLPDIPASELVWRFYFMVGAMAFTLVDPVKPPALQNMLAGENQVEVLSKRLCSFIVAGLSAPL